MQDLANTAWAFATASQSDAQLFAALARAAERRLGDFNVQELANTAWAFATASQSDAQELTIWCSARSNSMQRVASLTEDSGDSPPLMSRDSGNDEEFQLFWQSNSRPIHLHGDWVQYWSHPQVNTLPYWYNTRTKMIVWESPPTEGAGERGAEHSERDNAELERRADQIDG